MWNRKWLFSKDWGTPKGCMIHDSYHPGLGITKYPWLSNIGLLRRRDLWGLCDEGERGNSALGQLVSHSNSAFIHLFIDSGFSDPGGPRDISEAWGVAVTLEGYPVDWGRGRAGMQIPGAQSCNQLPGLLWGEHGARLPVYKCEEPTSRHLGFSWPGTGSQCTRLCLGGMYKAPDGDSNNFCLSSTCVCLCARQCPTDIQSGIFIPPSQCPWEVKQSRC